MSVPTHTKALDLAYIALMAALIALCAWISVPLGPVPFTMQTFGIFAALGLLGGRRGTLAFLIYLLLGIVGLPVFSGFSAGAGVLFGATGGYLLGYLAAALLFWGLTAKLGQTLPGEKTPGPITSVFQGVDFPMQVKDRVLEALEGHRGTYFSGEALAKELQVSRNAVWKAIRQLRDQGYPIHAVSNRGYSLAPDSAMLSPQSIAPFLTVPGLQVEVQPVVTSTNQVLRQRAEEGAHEGLALVAVTQTAGRGRRDHSFFSPPDSGLYLSFLLRPDLSARDALSLTTCAAASVALAIEECAGVDAKIKWVNDVFCHGKKVCGILTEAALDLETGGLQYAIVGIGVNLFPPKGGFPPELPEAGAVFPTRPQGLEGRSQLAGSILNHFFSFYPHLKDKPFFADYRRRSLVLGQEITVLEGGQTRTAFALDLERDFSLRVRETDGTIHTLSSGEVRVRPAHG